MKKFLLSIAAMAATIVLLFTACKKDSSASTSATFSPLTNGTNWTYSYTEGTAAPKTYKLTVTNKDTVANGHTYKVITSSDGAPNNYMGHEGTNYYRFASFPGIGIQNLEELYLKDNVATNDTWTGTANIAVSGVTISGNLLYTVKGTGETRTVNQTAYNKVTHVRLDISVAGFGGVGGGDFYYQEGVGMIESVIAVGNPLLGTYNSSQQLTAYEIK